jgi:N-hydroxyarylamine O-acetyltransferase
MIDLDPQAPRQSLRRPQGPADPVEPHDDWSVSELDLDAYLDRVGLAEATFRNDADSLGVLRRAHLETFRFENLDIMLGRGIRVDLPSIAAKMVGAGRGGYCYEHGQLFGAVLERLGFTVDRRLARVWRPGPVPPRTHMTLRVTLPAYCRVVRGIGPAGMWAQPEQTWLVDVGFGSSPAGPILLDDGAAGDAAAVDMAAGGVVASSGARPQELDGWTYDVVPGDRPGTWDLRELEGAEWVRRYQFDNAIVVPADVVMSNHYTSTYPESWFTHQPVVVRRDPDAIYSLVGRGYTVTRPGPVKEHRELSDDEWILALRDVFGLTFTEEEQARLRVTADGI